MHGAGRVARVAARAAALLAIAGPAHAGPPPATAFADPNGTGRVAISPNGRLLARDDDSAGVTRVILWDVDAARGLRVVTLDEKGQLRDLAWADDQTLLVTASVQRSVRCDYREVCRYEWSRTLAVPIDGSPPVVLLPDNLDRRVVLGSVVRAARTRRPHSITLETLDYVDSRERRQAGDAVAEADRKLSDWARVLFDVDTRTGQGRLLAAGSDLTGEWVVDAAGEPLARGDWNGEEKRYTVLAFRDRTWRVVHEQTGQGELSLAGALADGTALVAFGRRGADRSKAWRIPLDGGPVTLLLEDAQGDVEHAVYDPATGAVVGIWSAGMQPKAHWLDPDWARRMRTLAQAFPGRDVAIVDRSADGQRAVLRIESPSSPTVWQLLDLDRSRADIVGETYPALAHARLGDPRAIEYPARDGTRIPAYLTLPPGPEQKNLPLVVMPHGGPHLRDERGFDFLVQFLATRGYAVLQPQFRGSTGFGAGFARAGYRQWGATMQDDVTDGVRHLIADGTADPKRVCIVGASYGGYAALAGAAFTPELYACAASIGGVADLPKMVEELVLGQGLGGAAASIAALGLPVGDELAARSPARSAAKVRAPVLLLHGIDDSVVPIAQSERMSRALRKAGKPVTFVKLAGEDHWLSRTDTRLQVLVELEKFLGQYLR